MPHCGVSMCFSSIAIGFQQVHCNSCYFAIAAILVSLLPTSYATCYFAFTVVFFFFSFFFPGLYKTCYFAIPAILLGIRVVTA